MMGAGSDVDVDSGRIILRPSLAALLVCRQIPGAKWDSARKAWLFPATIQTAAIIRKRIRRLSESDRFKLLLTTSVTIALDPEQSRALLAGSIVPGAAAPIPPPDVQPAMVPVPLPTPVVEPEIVVDLPDGIRTSPWRHQRAAFKFCLDHFAAGLHGLLLAMGMGTGKSLVAILILLSLKARRIMIVCPLRVVQVWVAQLDRHCGVPILVTALDEDAGSVAKKQELALEKMRLAEVRGVPFVLVLNYDSAWRDPFAEWAEKLRWDLLILDEAHRIKAPSGKASLFFKRLRKMAIYRIALSGTPMPHGPMDIFGIFRAIDILIFGPSFSAFRQKYAVMGGYQRKQIVEFQRLDELERLMSRVTFRVGKEVLDLPPETDVTYHCELGAEARRVYDDLEEDFVALVRDGVVTAANAMVKILRLQQVCGGIAKTDEGVEHRIDDAKQKLLADTLEDIGPGEPVVVFCWFHLDLDAVHEAARSQEFTSMELSGRKDELKQWQDGKAQVLAVQIQAGGEGVDFTRARYSIFYSVGYSLGKYEQARARTHRPGQTNPVEHIHLIARNTVDVKIMRALAKRAEVVESILAEIKN
jgi:SNF2 family DNA or RNA helicase